jgi:hypothetical protein
MSGLNEWLVTGFAFSCTITVLLLLYLRYLADRIQVRSAEIALQALSLVAETAGDGPI